MNIDDKIRRTVATGITQEEVAAMFGVTLDEVRAALAASPASAATAPEPGEPEIEPAMRAQAIKSIDAGRSDAELASAYGLTPGQIAKLRASVRRSQPIVVTLAGGGTAKVRDNYAMITPRPRDVW